jgi:hypothetical protein
MDPTKEIATDNLMTIPENGMATMTAIVGKGTAAVSEDQPAHKVLKARWGREALPGPKVFPDQEVRLDRRTRKEFRVLWDRKVLLAQPGQLVLRVLQEGC